MFNALKRNLIGLVALLLTGFVVSQSALADDQVKKQIPLNQYGIQSPNPYVVNRFAVDGELIDEIIVPSRPRPPEGLSRLSTVIPEPNIAAGTNTISNVPALTWCFGCSATSAAMMFGHYDNAGYTNMYAGPTNGGVFPMTNATWGTVVIGGETRALCPLSATRLGLDGRATRGHVDDYWIQYGSSLPDPFIGNWTEHTHGECTADYMGTNQSLLSNTDGGTTFYSYTNGAPLYDYTGCEPTKRDGCHGMRLFAESRGYTVDTNFSQYIYGYNGNTQGFTFNDFKAEIDAGRPVVIQVTGHSMLGYGYDDVGSTIYIHDMWDYSAHSMTWGGTYSGMTHYGVAVVQLTTTPPTVGTPSSITVPSSDGDGSYTVVWGPSSTSSVTYILEEATNSSFTSGLRTAYSGPSTSTTITGRSSGTTYYYRVKATRSGYIDSSWRTGLNGCVVGALSLPLSENFSASTMPSGWTTQNIGTGISERWSVSNSNNAGGAAYEMKCSYQSVNPGTTRLITPAINTVGISQVTLSFRHFLNAYSTGANLRVQTSNDKSSWTNTVWSIATTSSNIGTAIVNVTITTNLNSSTTYFAFVVDGNLFQIDYRGIYLTQPATTCSVLVWKKITRDPWLISSNALLRMRLALIIWPSCAGAIVSLAPFVGVPNSGI